VVVSLLLTAVKGIRKAMRGGRMWHEVTALVVAFILCTALSAKVFVETSTFIGGPAEGPSRIVMGDLNQIGHGLKGHSVAVDNTLHGLRITPLHTDQSPALTLFPAYRNAGRDRPVRTEAGESRRRLGYDQI
jgi:hypothetical protein